MPKYSKQFVGPIVLWGAIGISRLLNMRDRSAIVLSAKVSGASTVKKSSKTGACPGFLKGGGSLGSLKKGHQILKGGGSNGLKGGVQYICLTMTTNLAYLDAKE